MICLGYKTPTAALYDLTLNHGPYTWWGGVTIGKFFIGIMKCDIDKVERVEK